MKINKAGKNPKTFAIDKFLFLDKYERIRMPQALLLTNQQTSSNL